MNEPPKPLAGIKVIDFTRHMAGPAATSMLADFGAEVIKVEGLPGGDGSRTTGNVFQDGESGLFLMWNRGKRDIALDLRRPEAKEIIDRLIVDADVLVENFRPGVAEKMGIGYERVSAMNPRLVHASVSAFGRGALADWPGTDPVVQAMSGVMSVTGEPGGEPLLVGVPIADFTGAMLVGQGILLALLARHVTGRGQKVDVSMLSGLISAFTTRLVSFWGTGLEPVPNGNAHSAVAPYQAYRTVDGYVMAGVWDNGWERFCAAIERPELAEDQRFGSNTLRVANRAELNRIIEPLIERRTTADWCARFQAANVLVSPVNSFADILAHPAIVESGILTTVEHPVLGEVRQVGPVIGLSDTPGSIAGPPPRLGEDSVSILEDLGFDLSEVADLVARRIVAAPDAKLPPEWTAAPAS